MTWGGGVKIRGTDLSTDPWSRFFPSEMRENRWRSTRREVQELMAREKRSRRTTKPREMDWWRGEQWTHQFEYLPSTSPDSTSNNLAETTIGFGASLSFVLSG